MGHPIENQQMRPRLPGELRFVVARLLAGSLLGRPETPKMYAQRFYVRANDCCCNQLLVITSFHQAFFAFDTVTFFFSACTSHLQTVLLLTHRGRYFAFLLSIRQSSFLYFTFFPFTFVSGVKVAPPSRDKSSSLQRPLKCSGISLSLLSFPSLVFTENTKK
jgi:hypothetical protein